MDYLEEHYGIDTREKYEVIEDQYTWCYGIDEYSVRKLIEKGKIKFAFFRKDGR